MFALNHWLFWGFIIIEFFIVLRGIILLKGIFRACIVPAEQDLSIIIPLKGWDETLPELVLYLLNQKYDKKMEVIVVADQENPRLNELPKASNMIVHHSLPLEEGWQDKNWRLYQGCQAARYETLLFLDSDVSIDREYLKSRLGSHKGELSFSIPLYMSPTSSSSRFLASCTNFLNFSIYKFGFYLCNLGTAIGPSMLFTCGRDVVSHALQITKKEIADDHALGFWFKENGYQVECSPEPVYVQADQNGNWSCTCRQLIRWFILPRTVTHLLHVKSILVMTISLSLNIMGCLWLLSGIMAALFYSPSFGLRLIVAALILMLTEALLLVLIERLSTKRTHHPSSWHHLIYLPPALIGLWILCVVALMKRSIKWRGKTIQLNSTFLYSV